MSESDSEGENFDTLPTRFTPKQEIVHQLVRCLSAQPTHRGLPDWVMTTLEQLENRLDANCHLCYIFAEYRAGSIETRGRAGIRLKNNLRDNAIDELPEYMQSYIKDRVLSCLGAPNTLIKQTVASIISSILFCGGFDSWPALLPRLFSLMSDSDNHKRYGSLLAMTMICEDHSHDLIECRQQPLAKFVPKWIEIVSAEDCEIEIRRAALLCLNELIMEFPGPMKSNLYHLLDSLFKIANDKSVATACIVCQAFTRLVCIVPEHMQRYMDNVIKYIFAAMASNNAELSLSAAEFWPRLAVSPLVSFVLDQPVKIKKMVQVLLKGIVIPDGDPLIDAAEEVGTVPDESKNLYPHSADYHFEGAADEEAIDQEEDEAEEQQYETFEDIETDSQPEWSLRNCCAASLDMMSCVLGEKLLRPLLELIGHVLNGKTTAWKILEASILALGAVANGCTRSIAQYLPKLIPFIVKNQRNAHPLVRSISCWTTSRFSQWLVSQPDPGRFFSPTLRSLLNSLLDERKVVQTAACFAMRVVQAHARELIIPYLPHVLQYYARAFAQFQMKNTVNLVVNVQKLADTVGRELTHPNLRKLLMEPLLRKLQQAQSNTYLLYPLFSCFTSIAVAFGPDFQPWASGLYRRCLEIIAHTLVQDADPNHDLFESKRAKIYCFDLIAGIAEGLGENFSVIFQDSSERLLRMLINCMDQKVDPQVRQAAFSLAGDLSRSSIRQIGVPNLKMIIRRLTVGINPGETSGLCNNAAWALSEIVLKLRDKMKDFVPEIISRLIDVILVPENALPGGLVVNCALALGRFSLFFASTVSASPKFTTFFPRYCNVIQLAPDDPEKEQALKGLCAIIASNPAQVRRHFPLICSVFTSWQREFSPSLQRQIEHILAGFKRAAGSQEAWDKYFKSHNFEESLRARLAEYFNFS